MPSLGFAIVLASLIADKLPLILKTTAVYKKSATGILVVMLVLFSIRTYTRNKVWKDNFTLFTTDVMVSENSLKCNVSAGGDYQKKAAEETDPVKKAEYYELSVKHLEKAIEIYPQTSNGLLLYGNVLTIYKKDYKRAIEQYLKILDFDPYNNNAYSNAVRVLGTLDNNQESTYKLSVLKRMYSSNPENAQVNYSLGKIYGQFRGNVDSARYFLERAIHFNPGDVAAYKDLGIVYSMQGEYGKALDIFSRAQQIDPGDPQIRQNIALTRQIMNQQRKPFP
jgi:tetratricopeptide (TPR) repeat protein